MIICPACNSENEDHYKFCLTCGVELASAPEKPDTAPRVGRGRAKLGDLKSKLQALRAGRGAFVESTEQPARVARPAEVKLPGWTEPPSVAPVVEETPRLTGDIAAPEFQDEQPGADQEEQGSAADEGPAEQPESIPSSEQESGSGDSAADVKDASPSLDGEGASLAQAADDEAVADGMVSESGPGVDHGADPAQDGPIQPSVTIASSSPQPVNSPEQDEPEVDEDGIEYTRPAMASLKLNFSSEPLSMPPVDSADDSLGGTDAMAADAAAAEASAEAEAEAAIASAASESGLSETERGLEQPGAEDGAQTPLQMPERVPDPEENAAREAAAHAEAVETAAATVEADADAAAAAAAEADGALPDVATELDESAALTDSVSGQGSSADASPDEHTHSNGDVEAPVSAELPGPAADEQMTASAISERPTMVSPVIPGSDTTMCDSCGAIVPRTFNFCGVCGAPVDWDQIEAQDGANADASPAASIGSMVLIHPDGSEGERFDLGDGNLVVGRDCEAALFANDPYLSPLHARFEWQGGWLIVHDLGSLNGIFIRLREHVLLAHGDLFRIGQQLLRFEEVRPYHEKEEPDGTIQTGSPSSGVWGRVGRVMALDTTLAEWTLRTPEVYIGRERGTISFPDDIFVSGTHCRIRRLDGCCELSDLGSTNGTYIRLKEATALSSGDLVLLGQQLFRIDLV